MGNMILEAISALGMVAFWLVVLSVFLLLLGVSGAVIVEGYEFARVVIP